MPLDRYGDEGDALGASVIARRRYDAMLPSSQSFRGHSAARLVLEWIILLCLWTIDRIRFGSAEGLRREPRSASKLGLSFNWPCLRD